MLEEDKTPEQPQDVVPKSELEKVQSESKSSIENLKKELDEAKLQLLDPTYIDWLNAKKQKTEKPSVIPGLDDLTDSDINNLKPAQLMKLIERKMAGTVEGQLKDAVNPQIQAIAGQLQQVSAYLELTEVKGKYNDFEDYRDSVSTILSKADSNLSIEQAYLMAKGQTPPKAATPTPAPKGGERPQGTVPIPEDTKKEFKSSNEAGAAAWEAVKAKHNISGDNI